MRRYETIIILKPTLGDDENQAVLDRATGNIEDGGGALVKTDKWGLKTLAYEIQKELQGYYIYTQYSGTPEAVAEMERLFRIDDRVMKYLTVKLQDVYTHMPEDDIAEDATAETSEAAPAETPVAEKAPVEAAPASDDTPAAEEAPAEETPASDDAPAAEEAPAEETPASDDAPVAEEAPAEEPAEKVED